jgi:hypothetical protein
LWEKSGKSEEVKEIACDVNKDYGYTVYLEENCIHNKERGDVYTKNSIVERKM